MLRLTTLAMLLAASATTFAQTTRVPTIDDLLNLKTVGAAQVSPDGRWVAYTMTHADFGQDAFVTHLWVSDLSAGGAGRSFQLTRGDKSAGSAQWSPDGQWLAFISARVDDRNQVFAIRPDGGEAVQLTNAAQPVGAFQWSPDGATLAFTMAEPAPATDKARRDAFGDFDVVRREYAHAHLWTLAVAEALRSPQPGVARTKGTDFTVGAFSWSPDGTRIAFGAQVNPDLVQSGTSDIYLLTLAGDRVTKLVEQPGPDTAPRWSPDGTQIVFTSAMGQAQHFAANDRLAIVPAAGGRPRAMTESFDEQPGFVAWNAAGLFFSGAQKTASHLFRVDPATGVYSRVSGPDGLMASGFSMSRDGRMTAFTAMSPTSVSEVFVSPTTAFAPRKLTSTTDQVSGWRLGTRELVEWKSRDGAVIEGVLIKPADFDPARRYPLLCIIHGGPTGIDRPGLLAGDTRYYPSDLWAARGALILKVNYRGSAGYGEAFRRLNVRNLGVGDAWDVISGVDHLIAKGWVDPARVASMGWSQGGYISAFLTTSSDRFAAISVGAGISNWATYYYNTDITPFTVNYLGDDPASDPEIYAKTSPMTYIRSARTPTLIQHGELDRRVPIPNAYELRQGLEDQGVPVEMIVYKGYGHGITRPKSMRAVMQHNLRWFNHYLWGDPLVPFGTAR